MNRTFALTVSLFLVSAAPALAQTHPQTHPQGRPHGQVGHDPIDPAEHAAMHAALLGSWSGTLSASQDASSKLNLAIAHDKHGDLSLTMKAERPKRAGTANNVVVNGRTIQWTQGLSGESCAMQAELTAATPKVPDTLNGTMTCAGHPVAFTLQKTKG